MEEEWDDATALLTDSANNEDSLKIDSRLPYAQICAAMRECTDDELLVYLDSGVVKFVNTVAEILHERNLLDRLYDTICFKTLKTVLGRKVALTVLLWEGRKFPRSYDACLRCLGDRSERVVEEALFGLCLWNKPEAIDSLEIVTAFRMQDLVELARQALIASDFRVFSPSFQTGNCWTE